MSEPYLEIKNLNKSFADKPLLKNLSLKIEKADFISILGASGCGKSTLLRLIAGLETKTSGEIIQNKKMRLSFVFQDACLLPWLTVKENVQLPFQLLKESPSGVEEALSLVNLSAVKNFYPHQLSGGMKMRTSIARALVTNPEILLMDEPFAALDEVTRFHLQDELRKIWIQKKITIIFVTHSVSESAYLSNRVLFLDQSLGALSGDLKIDLEFEREQSLKRTIKYNDYVTQLSSYFRKESL